MNLYNPGPLSIEYMQVNIGAIINARLCIALSDSELEVIAAVTTNL